MVKNDILHYNNSFVVRREASEMNYDNEYDKSLLLVTLHLHADLLQEFLLLAMMIDIRLLAAVCFLQVWYFIILQAWQFFILINICLIVFGNIVHIGRAVNPSDKVRCGEQLQCTLGLEKLVILLLHF